MEVLKNKNFIGIMVIFFVTTAIWGRLLLLLAKNKKFIQFCFIGMKIIKLNFNVIHTFFLNIVYLVVPIISMLVISFSFSFDIRKYFIVNSDVLKTVPIGILSEFSIVGLIMALLTLVSSSTFWTEQINSIPWIDSISFVPHKMGWIIPTSGAFLEEIFFRGFVFVFLYENYFSNFLWVPLIVAGIFFAIQQMLNTVTLAQSLSMAISSLAINFVGCILISITSSIIPSIIAHEVFVIFYLNQLTPSDGRNYVKYMES